MKTSVACPKCGNGLDYDEVSRIYSCSVCGARFRGGSARPQAPAQPPAPPAQYAAQPVPAAAPASVRIPFNPPAPQANPEYGYMQTPPGYDFPDDGGFESPAPAPARANAAAQSGGASSFDGTTIQLIGVNLLNGLLIIITLGIYAPWAICRKQRWICKHTLLEGVRLEFTGTGSQLIGKWILWCFLTVITLGIYSLVMPVRLLQWRTKHMKFHRANRGEAHQ